MFLLLAQIALFDGSLCLGHIYAAQFQRKRPLFNSRFWFGYNFLSDAGFVAILDHSIMVIIAILTTSIRSALTRWSLLNNRTLQMDKITISIYLDIHICLSINFQFQPKPDTESYTCDITSCHKCQLSTDLQGVMTYIISLVQSMWWILSGGGSCHVWII